MRNPTELTITNDTYTHFSKCALCIYVIYTFQSNNVVFLISLSIGGREFCRFQPNLTESKRILFLSDNLQTYWIRRILFPPFTSTQPTAIRLFDDTQHNNNNNNIIVYYWDFKKKDLLEQTDVIKCVTRGFNTTCFSNLNNPNEDSTTV